MITNPDSGLDCHLLYVGLCFVYLLEERFFTILN